MRNKMKSVAVMVMSLVLTGAVLTGCGESQQETKPDNAEVKTEAGAAEIMEVETKDETVRITEEYEDNFAVDSKAAKEFAEKVKDVTAKKDLEGLAALTAFPVYVGLPGVDVVETKEDFLKEYELCYKDVSMNKNIRPMTLEGCVVRISDIIAYIGRDIETILPQR